MTKITNAKIVIVRGGPMDKSPHIVTLVNFFCNEGYEVVLVNYDAKTEAVSDLSSKVKFITVSNAFGNLKLINRIIAALKIGILLRKEKSRVLYIIDSWTLPVFYVLSMGGVRFRQAKLIYHTFEWLEPGHHAFIYRFLEKWICRKADLVVGAERTRNRLLQTFYHINKTPLWVRNSLLKDVRLSRRDSSIREYLIEKASHDHVLMVYPSQVSGERLTMELITAFSYLPEKYVLATFHRNDEYYQKCLALISKIGLTHRIKLIPAVPHSQIMDYLACADIGAIFHDSSTSGNFMAAPQRLSEYAANGIPFVASDYPNMEALVYRYGLGLCCNALDPQDIARAIRALAEGTIPLSKRREHARKMFEQYLCFEVHGKKLDEAIRSVIYYD